MTQISCAAPSKSHLVCSNFDCSKFLKPEFLLNKISFVGRDRQKNKNKTNRQTQSCVNWNKLLGQD